MGRIETERPSDVNYSHTQKSPMSLILVAIGVVSLVGAVLTTGIPAAWIPFAGTAVSMVVLGGCFARMTVAVDDERLVIAYGPIPLFGAKFRLDEVTSVVRDRSTWMDGWGIHWVPGRGWTYNLWGFDCVRLELGQRTIRVGTDDPEGLLEALERHVATENVAA